MDTIIEIAKAGLNRFYDEGYVRWPEEKLRVLFSNHSLLEPEIERALGSWAAQGWIKLSKERREYIEVLTIIPD
jgi:hypothetical protein